MARMARISIMTTLFSGLALDITVPLVVLVSAVAVSECIFVMGDLFLMRKVAT